MGSLGQQLEEFNKQSTALYEEVKAASEACKTAAEARTRAELACLESPEDKDLQVLRDAASKEEQRAKEVWQQAMKQLDKLRALLVAKLPGEGLTLREAVAYPIPLLEKDLSPRESCSETRPRLPRTFSDILPWRDFLERSRELFNSLDDTECIYCPPVGNILPGKSLLPAADKWEVRGHVASLLNSVNTTAKRLEIPVQCNGGGNGRSMSFTDLVVRPAGAQSNPADLSSQILGTGQVKGDWQFQLKRGERLEDALHDPERIGSIVQAIQQVYGDAVMDEAPLLILTNYHVTVFLKRSEDVQDKRLWASEPIWFDQADPPARVSWVHGLQQAQELRHLKHRLPRAVVPPTQGYHIQLRPREARRQPQPALLSGPRKCQCTANQQADAPSSSAHHARQRSAGKPADVPSSSGSQTRLRPAQQLADKASSSAGSLLQRATQSPRLQAPSATGKGYEANSHPPAAQPVAAGLANPAAENTLLLSELGLTGELLEEGLYGHTLKGLCGGQAAAVKMYNLELRGAAAVYETEKLAYQALGALQGGTIPRLLWTGLMEHTAVPVIVTSLDGAALQEDESVPKHLHKPMRKALRALHAAGAAHGDVCHANFLVNGNAVWLIDLGSTVLRASRKDMDADLLRLEAMLPH